MSASFHEDVHAVIRAIYQAGIGDASWEDVAALIAARIGLTGATLVLHETRTSKVLSSRMVNFEHLSSADVLSEYIENYHQINPQVQFQKKYPLAPVYHESLDTVTRSKSYEEFTRWARERVGIHEYLTGFCRPNGDLTFAFAFSGDAGAERLDANKLELFRILMGHVQQAVAVSNRLEMLTAENTNLRAAIDAAERAVAILDRFGRPCFANVRMGAMLAASDGIYLSKKGFSFAKPKDQVAFERICASATKLSDAPSAGTLVVDRPSGKLPYFVGITPIIKHMEGFRQREPAILVTIRDPNPSGPVELDQSRYEAFRLTRTEGRLASEIAAGETLAAIAERRGVSVSTVRSQLKAVFSKVGVNRQAELVAVINALI